MQFVFWGISDDDAASWNALANSFDGGLFKNDLQLRRCYLTYPRNRHWGPIKCVPFYMLLEAQCVAVLYVAAARCTG